MLKHLRQGSSNFRNVNLGIRHRQAHRGRPRGEPTIPVTERALIQRINRKLRKDAEIMKVARGARAESNLGRYYTIDLHRNYLLHDHLDLETVGRELGVLAEFEHMVRE